MKIAVNIEYANKNTNVSSSETNATDALCVLNQFDHEGSSVYVIIESDNPEEVYKILRALEKDKL